MACRMFWTCPCDGWYSWNWSAAFYLGFLLVLVLTTWPPAESAPARSLRTSRDTQRLVGDSHRHRTKDNQTFPNPNKLKSQTTAPESASRTKRQFTPEASPPCQSVALRENSPANLVVQLKRDCDRCVHYFWNEKERQCSHCSTIVSDIERAGYCTEGFESVSLGKWFESCLAFCKSWKKARESGKQENLQDHTDAPETSFHVQALSTADHNGEMPRPVTTQPETMCAGADSCCAVGCSLSTFTILTVFIILLVVYAAVITIYVIKLNRKRSAAYKLCEHCRGNHHDAWELSTTPSSAEQENPRTFMPLFPTAPPPDEEGYETGLDSNPGPNSSNSTLYHSNNSIGASLYSPQASLPHRYLLNKPVASNGM